jgi:hypothetical protein
MDKPTTTRKDTRSRQPVSQGGTKLWDGTDDQVNASLAAMCAAGVISKSIEIPPHLSLSPGVPLALH